MGYWFQSIQNSQCWLLKKKITISRITIRGPKFSQFLSHTHLGINFQSDSHWNKHVHTIQDKAAERLKLRRMLKNKINRKSLVIIYNALICPVLDYGDIGWDNYSIKDSKNLEDLQVEAARIITGLRHNSSRSKLYDELGWDLLSTRRIIHKLILLYRIINDFAPQYYVTYLNLFPQEVTNTT